MALVSSKTIVLSRACFLWTVAFYLVKNPRKVTENGLVVIMSQAMSLVCDHYGGRTIF
jgi:hypothetical protein